MGDCMSKVRIYGDTSGYIDVAAPATADNSTLDLSTVVKEDANGNISGELTIKPTSDNLTANGLKISRYDNDSQWTSITNSGGTSITTTETIFGTPTFKLYSSTDGTNVTERFKVDHEGRVTMPYQPSFHGRGAQTRQTGTFDSWTTVHHNNGNHFNTSNGTFTAPVDGYYQCGATLLGTSMTTGHWLGIAVRINGVTQGQTAYQTASTTNDTSATVSCVVYASAGDGLTLYAANQSANYNYYGFSIHLVG